MKIKTFVNVNPTQLDDLVNKFEEGNNVKATQTSCTWNPELHAMEHKAVLFFMVK